MKSKRVLGLLLAAVMAAVCISPALADGTLAADETQAVQKREQRHRQLTLAERAEKLGISTEGLTDEEIQTAIDKAMEEKIIAKAQEMGIDTTGMSNAEIVEAVKAAMKGKMAGKVKDMRQRPAKFCCKELSSEQLSALAAKLGINTSGMNDDEIREAVRAEMKEKMPEKAGSKRQKRLNFQECK